MTFDKETRQAIAKAIENGISAKMEVYEEEWVTDAKLCELLPALHAELPETLWRQDPTRASVGRNMERHLHSIQAMDVSSPQD